MSYLIIDVFYIDDMTANCSGVLVDDLSDITSSKSFLTVYNGKIADYKAGDFYKREMPIIMDFFNKVSVRPETIVVDGLVHLPKGKPALGARLQANLSPLYFSEGLEPPVVIGVAKNEYKGFGSLNKVYRGSIKPLIITSSGRDVGISKIKEDIKAMPGVGRIPAMIIEADAKSRLNSEVPV